MPTNSLSHSTGQAVESKAQRRLDGLGRVDLARHERVALVVRVVGGVAAAAKIADVSRSTIVNWRKTGANQPIDGLSKLAGVAGVSLDWLAGMDLSTNVDRHLEAALLAFAQGAR